MYVLLLCKKVLDTLWMAEGKTYLWIQGEGFMYYNEKEPSLKHKFKEPGISCCLH